MVTPVDILNPDDAEEHSHATQTGDESENDQLEHSGPRAQPDQGGAPADAQAERGDCVEQGREKQEPLKLLRFPAHDAAADPAHPEEHPVVKALDEMARLIRAGEMRPVGFIMHYLTEDGAALRHGYWRHNLRPIEHLGLLEFAKAAVLDEETR